MLAINVKRLTFALALLLLITNCKEQYTVFCVPNMTIKFQNCTAQISANSRPSPPKESVLCQAKIGVKAMNDALHLKI